MGLQAARARAMEKTQLASISQAGGGGENRNTEPMWVQEAAGARQAHVSVRKVIQEKSDSRIWNWVPSQTSDLPTPY